MTRVSDHALLRYLERAQGIDVEAWRVSIESSVERAAIAAAKLGIDTYSIRLDGVLFVVRAGTMTTVLPKIAERSRFHALGPRDR